jgi:ABC-type glycerol-3-phosphate transport system permease component
MLYAAILALLAFVMLPLVYIVFTAFKPWDELFYFPPRFFVRRPTLENFADLLLATGSAEVPLTRYLFNSLFVSAVVVAGTVFVSTLGAYGLVKYRLRFKGLIFGLVIMTMTFSGHVTAIPNFMVVSWLGMINSYAALIVPKIAIPYNFFLMKQFIEQVPDTMLEAARLDGAGEFALFSKVVLPQLRPAWGTLAVLSFAGVWNDYFSAMIFTRSEAIKTLPLVMQTIANGNSIGRAGVTAAATLVMTLPTIILFVVMQGKVMSTMSYSGIKT